MVENERYYFLFSEWKEERGVIEGFLKEPLKWVADELEKVYGALPRGFKDGRQGEKMQTLTDMIRFINANKNLLMPKEYRPDKP